MNASEALNIDHAAPLEILDQAYTILNQYADDGGAYPGSKQWKACRPYSIALYNLITARPDLEPYRGELAAIERRKTLEGVDVLGL